MIVQAILVVLCSLLYAVYTLSKSKFNYWKKKNVPYKKPTPIFGNYSKFMLFKRSLAEVAEDIAKQFPNEPYVGTFYGTEPALLIRDPNFIKTVMTKDFYYFSSRENNKYCDKELITRTIFASGGDRWKVVRQNLTNIFTSAKMKAMFPLIENCAKQFETLLSKDYARSQEMDAKFTMARFTMGCIGSCIFGVETGTLTDSKDRDENLFMKILDLTKSIRNNLLIFMFYFRAIWPRIFYAFKLRAFNPRLLKYLTEMITGIFKSRDYKPSTRNDFIDMLLELAKEKYITGDSLSNMKTGENKKVQLEVNDELLVAQCLIMFVAGFETSATTSSFVLYELSKNQEAQKKAQAEVDNYLKKHNGKVGYECTSELPYLEACIDEALRLYPVLGVLTREVVENYTFPNGLQLEAGARVHIPVRYLQRNPEFFPEPEKYKPERFLSGNKENIVPYTYMPFGEGPRTCIGECFISKHSYRIHPTITTTATPHVRQTYTRRVIFQNT